MPAAGAPGSLRSQRLSNSMMHMQLHMHPITEETPYIWQVRRSSVSPWLRAQLPAEYLVQPMCLVAVCRAAAYSSVEYPVSHTKLWFMYKIIGVATPRRVSTSTLMLRLLLCLQCWRTCVFISVHAPEHDRRCYVQEIARFLRNPRKPAILAMSRPDAKKNITTLVNAFGKNTMLRELANLVLIMVRRVASLANLETLSDTFVPVWLMNG